MSSLADIKLALDVLGRGTVEVNGVDHSNSVKGVTVYATAGDVVEVVLHLHAEATLFEGPGVVKLDPPVDMVTQLADLLEAFDPADLERRALNSPDLGSGEAAVTRQVLIEAARMLRGRA